MTRLPPWVLTTLVLVGCSSPTSEGDSAEKDGGGVDATSDAQVDAGPDAAPSCGPLETIPFDAGTPGTFAGKEGAHCTRDIDCAKGTFCLVVEEVCQSSMLMGPGLGGHLGSGGACAAEPAFPGVCDALALDWSPTSSVSPNAGSLAESDCSIATDGQEKILVAWANNTAGVRQQFNGLALSKDVGKSFAQTAAPSHLPTDAENDASLAIDSQGLFYYVWEGYAENFAGAQHVWSSTSTDGSTWSTPLQVDTPADGANGTIPLDFPNVALNPINRSAYYTYQVTSNSGPIPIRLVIGAPGGATVGSSIELDDGKRPDAFRDLANGVFDSKGNYYAAWTEGGSGSTGMGLESGSTDNAAYFTRVDMATGNPAPLGEDVKVSTDGEDVAFGIPQVLASSDASSLYVVYQSGLENALDVRMVVSHDRGATWGPSVKVNDDTSCATHYHASAALDQKGRVWVLWYDNREGSGHVVYSVTDDGGKTFHPNRLVSAAAFPFETFQYSVGWLGDYFQVIASGDELLAAWSDPHVNDQSHIQFARGALPP